MNVVHNCWLGFIAAGAPTCPDGMPWPAYNRRTDRTLVFGVNRAVTSFRKAAYDILDSIEEAEKPR
ncbi:MAG: hypothetical protein WDM85_04200 [Caulobacteraceae bacterium]